MNGLSDAKNNQSDDMEDLSCSPHELSSWDAESIPEFGEPRRWAHEAP